MGPTAVDAVALHGAGIALRVVDAVALHGAGLALRDVVNSRANIHSLILQRRLDWDNCLLEPTESTGRSRQPIDGPYLLHQTATTRGITPFRASSWLQ